MGTDQTLALSRFRSLYKRMEAEGASTEDLLSLARTIHAEELRRDQKLRELRDRRDAKAGKAKPVKKKDSLADIAELP